MTVAETTIARAPAGPSHPLPLGAALSLMIAGAAIIVWIAVTVALRPLYQLRDAIGERSPDDLHPIEQSVPSEVQPLVDTVNALHGAPAIGARCAAPTSPATPATSCARRWRSSAPSAAYRPAPAPSPEAQAAALKGDQAVAHAERILAQLLLMAKIDAARPRSADGLLRST